MSTSLCHAIDREYQHQTRCRPGQVCQAPRPDPRAPVDTAGRTELRALLEATVAGGFDVEEALLRLPNRGVARIALARQVAMYLAHVACGMTKTDVGRLFDRDRTTVHHACAVIEERRDEANFNRALDHLERVVRIVLGPRGDAQ